MAQVVEHLPSKYETLKSNPSIEKKILIFETVSPYIAQPSFYFANLLFPPLE
jgi:hypothetical protein